jgi:hypothetical protein
MITVVKNDKIQNPNDKSMLKSKCQKQSTI